MSRYFFEAYHLEGGIESSNLGKLDQTRSDSAESTENLTKLGPVESSYPISQLGK